MSRSLLFEKKLSTILRLWILKFTCLIGCQPNQLKDLRVGCICFLHVPFSAGSKVDEKALLVIFWWYSSKTNGFIIYGINEEKNVIIRDGVFNEGAYWDFDMKQVCKDKNCTLGAPRLTDTIISFDVDGNTNSPVLIIQPLSDVYKYCKLQSKPTNNYDAQKSNNELRLWMMNVLQLKRTKLVI